MYTCPIQPDERIGCRPAGIAEIKAHPFFRSIDWEALYMKEISPPYVPQTSRKSDVSNVDPEFLAETPEETPVQDSQLAAMAGEDGEFDNFTYVNQHNLSELSQGPNNFAAGSNRPQTEIMDLKSSFAIQPDDQSKPAFGTGATEEASE